jgi:hypothetical protein
MANPIVGSYGSPQAIHEVLDVTATNQTRAEGHHKVGTRGYLPDGRVFYYASNGTVALTVGRLVVTANLTRSANHDSMVLTTGFANFAAGKTSILFDRTDLDTDDIIRDEYAEGYLGFEAPAGAGHGHTYKIKGHGQFDAAGTTAIDTIELYDPLKITATATDELKFCRNKWDRVVLSTTAEEELVVGVTPVAVAASDALATSTGTAEVAATTRFFWAQTWGPAMVEATGTAIVEGSGCMSSAAAGTITFASVATHAATATTVLGLERNVYGVGMGRAIGTTLDFQMIDLMIAP